MSSVPVYSMDPGKHKPIKAGALIGDTFHKTVKRSKHYLRIVAGYAIQLDVFKQLQELGIKTVNIVESDTGAIYTSPLTEWVKNGGTWSHGHGEQRTLSTKYMTCINQKG